MSTLSERILGAGAGAYVDRTVDRAYVHDGTGLLARAAWTEIGSGVFTDPDRRYLIFGPRRSGERPPTTDDPSK